MPKAATHDRITVITAAALTPLLYVAAREPALQRWLVPLQPLDLGLFAVAHLVSGYYFSPDLDVDSRIHRRWGPLGVIWAPYRCMIPHRHFWSHSLVIAPLLRLVYLYVVVQLLLLLVNQLQLFGVFGGLPLATIDPQALLRIVLTYPQQTLLMLIGFITGSAAHTVSDWLVTAVRGRSR
jgi:uncharacterized metal-binding protein